MQIEDRIVKDIHDEKIFQEQYAFVTKIMAEIEPIGRSDGFKRFQIGFTWGYNNLEIQFKECRWFGSVVEDIKVRVYFEDTYGFIDQSLLMFKAKTFHIALLERKHYDCAKQVAKYLAEKYPDWKIVID